MLGLSLEERVLPGDNQCVVREARTRILAYIRRTRPIAREAKKGRHRFAGAGLFNFRPTKSRFPKNGENLGGTLSGKTRCQVMKGHTARYRQVLRRMALFKR